VDEILNPIAEREGTDSGLYCIPSEAKNYPNSRFYCIDENCNDPQRRLFVKRSKLGRYFFSHYGNYQHDISPETLLHKLTIKSFEGLTEFQIPSFKDGQGNFYPEQMLLIDPNNTVLEFRELKGIRPDVTIVSIRGMQLAVEIFVTNRTKEKKVQRLNEHKLPTVELNLNDFYLKNKEQCKTDVPFIRDNAPKLVAELRRKKWLQLPTFDQVTGLTFGDEPQPEPPSQPKPSPGQGCLLLFVIPILLGMIWFLI
jgi:hypothetical protein